MTKQLHVRNHFVPQTYLKRWEDADRKISAYKTLVSHENVSNWEKYPTSAIAFQKHLYIQVLNGKESDDLEKWFDQEFESPASAVIDKATNDQKLTRDDWYHLIKFLAAQDVRTPVKMYEHIKRASESYEDLLKGVLEDLKNMLVDLDLAGLEEYKNSPDLELDLFPLKITTEIQENQESGIIKAEGYVGRSSWINSMKYLLKNTSKVLHDHRWTIIKPAKGYNWITSDNPVVKLNYIDEKNYDLGGGWGKLKGNIIFPLGPQHAMFVQIGDKALIKNTRLTVKQTVLIRKIIAENAHRMIFSLGEDNEITKFKKRVVNAKQFQWEGDEMLLWHQKNADLEREYFKSNHTNIIGTIFS